MIKYYAIVGPPKRMYNTSAKILAHKCESYMLQFKHNGFATTLFRTYRSFNSFNEVYCMTQCTQEKTRRFPKRIPVRKVILQIGIGSWAIKLVMWIIKLNVFSFPLLSMSIFTMSLSGSAQHKFTASFAGDPLYSIILL